MSKPELCIVGADNKELIRQLRELNGLRDPKLPVVMVETKNGETVPLAVALDRLDSIIVEPGTLPKDIEKIKLLTQAKLKPKALPYVPKPINLRDKTMVQLNKLLRRGKLNADQYNHEIAARCVGLNAKRENQVSSGAVLSGDAPDGLTKREPFTLTEKEMAFCEAHDKRKAFVCRLAGMTLKERVRLLQMESAEELGFLDEVAEMLGYSQVVQAIYSIKLESSR